MITAAIKDKVLFYLCKDIPLECLVSGSVSETLTELDISFDEFKAVMYYFQRIGFLEELNLRRDNVAFILLTESHDYAQKGGFFLQEDIFKGNLQKLELEIENLKKQLGPDKLDELNKMSAIASALFSGLALLPR